MKTREIWRNVGLKYNALVAKWLCGAVDAVLTKMQFIYNIGKGSD